MEQQQKCWFRSVAVTCGSLGYAISENCATVKELGSHTLNTRAHHNTMVKHAEQQLIYTMAALWSRSMVS